MRKKFSESFWLAGGANGDLRDSNSKPMIKKVSSKRARSERFLRTHNTTASTSSFSSANSKSEMKVSFEFSGGNSSGIATYKMLFSGLRTDSHLVNLSSVTCNLMVMLIGFSCCKICLTISWQSSSEYNEWASSSTWCKSEHCDDEDDDDDEPSNKLPPAESTEFLRV